ncbi:MAG: hypothetical protein K9I68_08655 [Bacteroidales bacterium]|nr:hypothetical protein [Bacteroidales bacterium]MCF8338095.1 hypothetical protein [Bacteroidales bacterium]
MKDSVSLNQKYTRVIDLVTHASFIVLIIGAIVFYKERLLADSSYYLFQVINQQFFHIEHARLILVFSQILPLLGTYLGISMKGILLLYSLNHVLFPYLVYLVARYRYDFPQAGIIFILLQIIGITHGYFVPMFELYYGSYLLIFFAILLHRQPNSKSFPAFQLFLVLLILSSHPYAFLLLGFVILSHALRTKWRFRKQYIRIAALMAIFIVFKLFFATEYEQNKSQAFIYALTHHTYDLDYLKNLVLFLFRHYTEVLMIFVITVIIFLYQRKFIQFFTWLGFTFLILAMVNVSHYGFEISRYQEQIYYSWVFMIVFPALFYGLGQIEKKKPKFLLILSFLLIGTFHTGDILKISKEFLNRRKNMERVIEKGTHKAGDKFYVDISEVKGTNRVPPNWSYPIETMLLSVAGDKECVTVCTSDDMEFARKQGEIKPGTFLFRKWDVFPLEYLNENYFKLTDTGYKKIEV